MNLRLVVYVVPDDNIVHSGRHRATDREDQTSIERLSQQIADFATLDVVR